MIDHDIFRTQITAALAASPDHTLTRGEVFELLVEHIATSPHRMALPPEWSLDQVRAKLRIEFTGHPLIERMIEVLFDEHVSSHSPQHAHHA